MTPRKKKKKSCALHASIDERLSREGITKTVSHLQLLSAYNEGFVSCQETMLNTDNELISLIVIGVILYFAQFEVNRKSERVKAGQRRTREEGKIIGRESKFGQHKQKIAKLLKEGKGKWQLREKQV